MNKRYFKLLDTTTGEYIGRYSGKNPMTAAKKAANRYLTDNNLSTSNITIRESTKDSDKKVFNYIAKKEELETPVTVMIKGKPVEFKHRINVSAI